MTDFQGRRVLLIGGLGFLGLNIVPAFLDAGASIRVVNRSLHPLALSWLERVRADRHIEVLQGDIAIAHDIAKWLDGVDVIIDLAGESGAVRSLRDTRSGVDVNIAGQLNLLDAIRETKMRPRVVFASSRLVYGVTGVDAVAEDHPQLPTSLYGLHKLTVEHYYRIYHAHYGIPYTILRLTNPYGPYQLPQRSHYGIVNRFIMAALRGETLHIFGGGQQLRDYIHSRDVAGAVLRASDSPGAIGEVFNVGSGRTVSFGWVARRIVELANKGNVDEVPWPDGFRKVETGDFACDVRKIETLLGWHPHIALDEGLLETIDCYRSLLS